MEHENSFIIEQLFKAQNSSDCIAIPAYNEKIITCPDTSIIRIADVSYGQKSCPAQPQPRQNIEHFKDPCKDQNICLVRNNEIYAKIASIYFKCGDANDIKVDDITTESHGRSSIPDEYISTESPGGPNYAAIVGGIVGGVLLIICIIVGVLLLRKRNCTASGKENVMTNLNLTYDPTHGQTEPDNNQQAHLMNSSDAIHISTSHAVDNAANEVSNTYSHLRNIVDDSDVTYDHTLRNNIHDICDGHYRIAHRRITEDDYDVSRNYCQSLCKEADPVYN
ncbi:unnamed protein product [Mytilus coruscus]|uniref:SUEL-type lectin domain-containing protein n=1 Tax=Mytilus coruscus TaxID=42192 RepID=A0A6J8D1M1_MYTCO|nr:unnamed protein product [Mytilus coruscus]